MKYYKVEYTNSYFGAKLFKEAKEALIRKENGVFKRYDTQQRQWVSWSPPRRLPTNPEKWVGHWSIIDKVTKISLDQVAIEIFR